MKLTNKFLLGAVVRIAVMLIAVAFGVLVVRSVHDGAVKVTKEALPSVMVLDAINTNVSRTKATVLEMLLSDDDQDMKDLLQELAETKTDSSDLIKRYQTDYITDDLERSIFDDFFIKHARLWEKTDTIATLAGAHDLAQAKRAWKDLDDQFDGVQAAIWRSREHDQQIAEIQLSDAERKYQYAVATGLWIIVFFFVVNFGSYYWSYRKIARPIQRLSDELKNFDATHDLTHRFAEQKLSELSVITRSLNQLMRWVESNAIELQSQRDQIHHLANHDHLTGLPLWRLGKDRLEVVLAWAHRAQEKIALMFIDLDGFKTVNDSYGHDAGDYLLKEVAKRLKHQLRAEDTVARMGGDEFVVILGRLAEPQIAEQIAKRMIAAVVEQVIYKDQKMHVGASVGIALFPDHGSEVASLLAAADNAMYAVKRAGKNNFAFFQPLDQTAPAMQSDSEVGGIARN